METTLASRLKAIRHFLLDLDGTVYLDREPIPGALDFIACLIEKNIDYLFLTNNSSKAADDYVQKLAAMGFPVEADQVMTSGQATGWYIERNLPGARIYVLGTVALKKELSLYNVEVVDESSDGADFVVAGFDTELTYSKLLTACRLLTKGAEFIATNPDLVCPMGNNQYIPDCGSICVLIENATGKKPLYIGKPNPVFVEYFRARRGIHSNDIAMVGDRLYTDIALGCNSSILSICVLSGESDQAAIDKSDCKPDIVVNSVSDLIPLL